MDPNSSVIKRLWRIFFCSQKIKFDSSCANSAVGDNLHELSDADQILQNLHCLTPIQLYCKHFRTLSNFRISMVRS